MLRSNGLKGRRVRYVVSGKLQVQGDTRKWYSLSCSSLSKGFPRLREKQVIFREEGYRTLEGKPSQA